MERGGSHQLTVLRLFAFRKPLQHLVVLPLSTAVGRDVGAADSRAAQRSGGGVYSVYERGCSSRSAIRSPIIMQVALVFARMQSGMIEASATRMPSSPCTRPA